MDNETSRKRSLILLLVILTVVIFIGLVWLITVYEPWTLLGISSSNVPAVTPRVERNCTYPVGYWREHPELYPPEIVVGSRVYEAAEISGTLSGESQDIGSQLQAQLIAAYLNVLSGSDQNLINDTIFQAYGWVVEHPDESQATDGERETGARLATILEAYNLGQAGVAICTDGVSATETETATSSMTPTATSTGIASETSTLTPTVTPSSTLQPTNAVWTPPQATPTRTATTQAPGGPPPPTSTTAPSATQEPPPVPTNTPIPPTNTPIPPTAAPSSTLPPLPTLPTPP